MIGIEGGEAKYQDDNIVDIELGMKEKNLRRDEIAIEWRNVTYKTAPKKDEEGKTLLYTMSGKLLVTILGDKFYGFLIINDLYLRSKLLSISTNQHSRKTIESLYFKESKYLNTNIYKYYNTLHIHVYIYTHTSESPYIFISIHYLCNYPD